LKVEGDFVLGGFVQQGEDVALKGTDAAATMSPLQRVGRRRRCLSETGIPLARRTHIVRVMRAQARDPEDAAGEGALLAPETDSELDAEIAFFVAPGVDAVGAGKGMRAGDEAYLR
jgi:hypothetical protein